LRRRAIRRAGEVKTPRP